MNNTQVSLSLILSLVLGIFIGSSFKSCGKNNDIIKNTDTVVITKTRIDTIVFERIITKTKGGTIKKDTTKKDPSNEDINFFTQEYDDSLISGILHSMVRGDLLSTELIYIPKFPKYILRTDSILTTITNNITKIEYRQPFGFIVGGGFGANPSGQFNVMPQVGVQLKQNINFIYGYDFINKSHNIMIHKVFPIK